MNGADRVQETYDQHSDLSPETGSETLDQASSSDVSGDPAPSTDRDHVDSETGFESGSENASESTPQEQISEPVTAAGAEGSVAAPSINYNLLLLAIFASSLIDFMSYGMIVPILPFFAKTFGAVPVLIGLLLGSYDFMNVFAPSIWGSWSERVGRRRAMLVNIGGTTISCVIFGLANSLPMLFVGRILSGGSGSSIVIGQSYIARYAKDETRTRDLGILESSAVLGIVVGSLITAFLVGSDSNQVNYNVPGMVAAGVSFSTFCLAFTALPRQESPLDRSVQATDEPEAAPTQVPSLVQAEIESSSAPLDRSEPLETLAPTVAATPEGWSLRTVVNDLVEVIRTPAVGRLSILFLLLFFAQAQAQTTLPLWFDYRFHWGPQQYSYLLIFCALMVGGTQIGLVGILSRWVGESNLVIWGFASMAVGAFFFPFAGTLPLVVILIVISTWGQGVSHPSTASLLISQADLALRGRALGVARSFASLGSFLGALQGGFLFGSFGPEWPYWVAGGTLLITVVFTQGFIRRCAPDPEAQSLAELVETEIGSQADTSSAEIEAAWVPGGSVPPDPNLEIEAAAD